MPYLLRSEGVPRSHANETAGNQASQAIVARRDILGDAHGPAEAAVETILGNEAKSFGASRARRRAGRVAAVEPDGARLRGLKSGDRLAEFGLAVAIDAGDSDDLAGAYLEVDPVEKAPAGGGRER